jgi:hypothetical protein
MEDLRLLERLSREEMDRLDTEETRAALKEAEKKGNISLVISCGNSPETGKKSIAAFDGRTAAGIQLPRRYATRFVYPFPSSSRRSSSLDSALSTSGRKIDIP